jgi:isopentenyl diphosphate isomerase/L-lactate dehydrogenase-like FMN-dependent dehydrogenase
MKSDRSLARSVSFPRVINIHDFRRLARRRLPAVVFAYIDGGAEDEITLRDNSRAFRDLRFRPRQCVRSLLRSAHNRARHDVRPAVSCWRRSASAACFIQR